MNVIVIGGGASGMMAAITATRSGHQVTLLERQARVGRKLMTTGNGRCNLTNRNASPEHYHGDSSFMSYALEHFSVDDTLTWFKQIGLLTTTESSGRVYPCSNMAGSVLDVLRYTLERENVNLVPASVVTSIRSKNNHFIVTTEDEVFESERVILAAGGAAGSKVGGGMDGYQLAKKLGHHRTALYPSLVQIKTDPTYPRSLKGVKADALVSIYREDQLLGQNFGEVLFTEYGISGPAVFEISRTAAVNGDGLHAELDFFSTFSAEDILAYLTASKNNMKAYESGQLLVGSVHTKLGQMICKSAGFTNQPVSTLSVQNLHAIAHQMKHFTLPILGVCGFDQAQVTAGGLICSEFSPTTMESLIVPGLYACGEVLDIDGDCGGYNLQWAWSSGHLAGQLL